MICELKRTIDGQEWTVADNGSVWRGGQVVLDYCGLVSHLAAGIIPSDIGLAAVLRNEWLVTKARTEEAPRVPTPDGFRVGKTPGGRWALFAIASGSCAASVAADTDAEQYKLNKWQVAAADELASRGKAEAFDCSLLVPTAHMPEADRDAFVARANMPRAQPAPEHDDWKCQVCGSETVCANLRCMSHSDSAIDAHDLYDASAVPGPDSMLERKRNDPPGCIGVTAEPAPDPKDIRDELLVIVRRHMRLFGSDGNSTGINERAAECLDELLPVLATRAK